MGCRIGITTNPEQRKKDWQEDYKYRKFRSWKIIQTFRSKTAAQKWENEEKESSGCVAHAGGSGSEIATWSGYKFFFD